MALWGPLEVKQSAEYKDAPSPSWDSFSRTRREFVWALGWEGGHPVEGGDGDLSGRTETHPDSTCRAKHQPLLDLPPSCFQPTTLGPGAHPPICLPQPSCLHQPSLLAPAGLVTTSLSPQLLSSYTLCLAAYLKFHFDQPFAYQIKGTLLRPLSSHSLARHSPSCSSHLRSTLWAATSLPSRLLTLQSLPLCPCLSPASAKTSPPPGSLCWTPWPLLRNPCWEPFHTANCKLQTPQAGRWARLPGVLLITSGFQDVRSTFLPSMHTHIHLNPVSCHHSYYRTWHHVL